MKTITEAQVLALLRAEVDRAGSIRAWGRRHGVSAMYVSNCLRKKQLPGPAICEPLGVVRKVRQVVTYMRVR
jgi:hypothetical protein